MTHDETPMVSMRAVAALLGMRPDEVARAVSAEPPTERSARAFPTEHEIAAAVEQAKNRRRPRGVGDR